MPRQKSISDIARQLRRIDRLGFGLESRAYQRSGGMNEDWRRARRRRETAANTASRYARNVSYVNSFAGGGRGQARSRNVYAARNTGEAISNFRREYISRNARSASRGGSVT